MRRGTGVFVIAPNLPVIATEPLDFAVSAGTPFVVEHGLGRQVGGYLVVWSSGYVSLKVADPDEDTRQQITLVPNASVSLRLVLL
jgi:hypothetical protein